ncbi:MAG: hypothetical protein BWK79_10435 [Beggiatoa sp. IS2]|nr:MAG: hypothetical protein BWK79_10435 [Beggiatoa sp. IS2]
MALLQFELQHFGKLSALVQVTLLAEPVEAVYTNTNSKLAEPVEAVYTNTKLAEPVEAVYTNTKLAEPVEAVYTNSNYDDV